MKKGSKSYQKLFKAALATSVATGAMVVLAPVNSDAAITSFKDLKSTSDHHQPVLDLAAKGIIQGYTDGTFKPDNTVTRGQAAKIIALAVGLDTKEVKNPGFKDIKTDNQYYGPIAALVQAGIITGFEDNTYRPGDTLTRGQMAKIIALAFDLPEEQTINNSFKDVKEAHWFKGYVQTLVTNNITKGTTATSFEPGAAVKRGQLASFVVRAEKAVDKGDVVVSVKEGSIELASGTYTLSADLQKVLNVANADALAGAKLKFTAKDGAITAIQSLTITKNKATLDGAGASVVGNVVVSGDSVTLKNLTVTGDLKLGNEVKTSFVAEKITVKGKTTVSDKKALVASLDNQFLAALANGTSFTFNNSTLNDVDIAQSGAKFELKGTGTVKNVNVTTDASVTAASGITIAKLTIAAGVKDVSINANVTTLDVKNTATKLTLSATTKITNLVLPAGVKAADVIANYEAVKANISQIGGVKNPDATAVTGGGAGAGAGAGPGPDNDSQTPPPTQTAQQKLDAAILAGLTSADTKDGTISIVPNGNTFNVTIDDESTFENFTALAKSIHVQYSPIATLKSVIIPYKTFNIEKTFTTNVSFDTAVKEALKDINELITNIDITEESSLSLLKGKTISFTVAGTYGNDNEPVNGTYTFVFAK